MKNIKKEIAFVIESVNGTYTDTIEMTESYYNANFKDQILGVSHYTRIVVYKDC